jgi:hypothetical protein
MPLKVFKFHKEAHQAFLKTQIVIASCTTWAQLATARTMIENYKILYVGKAYTTMQQDEVLFNYDRLINKAAARGIEISYIDHFKN